MTTPLQNTGGQGQLAKLLEARGGSAAPEAPFVIEHREALIYMLCEAAELEHLIMCQYLYAAFSLKQRTDEGLTADELTTVTRWRATITHVASQEMLHLALVQNVLSAIGAAPHLSRPNLPQPARHYPPGVTLALLPFGEAALAHFMFLERPEGMQLDDADGLAAIQEAVPTMESGDIVPRLQDFGTIGHLYRSIEAGLATLTEKYGEQWLFVGPPRAQATEASFGWSDLVAVTDLASAQQAVDTILEQGEGARGDWRGAHFGQFVDILDEYQQMTLAKPDFDPVRPVHTANVRPCEHDATVPLISDPATARCVDLFNVGYEILLQMLDRYFAHTEETDDQLQTLAHAAVSVMLRVLNPLGSLITDLPVGPQHPGRTAGPSFELFYESDYLVPHRGAAWTLLEERLREAAAFCDRSLDSATKPVSERLVPVTKALSGIADSLAAHFPDWGSVSRWVQPAPPVPVSRPDDTDIEALLLRADELGAAVPGAATGLVADLFRDASSLLRTLADESAITEREHVATRLLDSVLRPLGDALATGLVVIPATEPGAQDAANTGESVDDVMWGLAEMATRLRAALPTSMSGGAAALVEATAALQDLAIEHSPAVGEFDAAARLDRLRELQAAAACAIHPAHDGPYLVTNADYLRDWLGQRLPSRPQMALCRCGMSSLKPLCDGSHARAGFEDTKDPKRVVDRRDSYVGQQVTVLDNRGICQHSGYCTDRLATVFHLGEEPFVTPSGGRMDEIIRAVRDCPSGALSYAVDGVEARGQVDFAGERERSVEVSKDGPYRVTGGIPLVAGSGDDEPRNDGASREHYALCRCGQSQNKPFCSGMHWYVDFTDPVPDPERTPTIFEWAGGLPALTRMTRLFYEKYVPNDPMLAPIFANMSADHPQRVAKWLGEVFGGPTCYSDEYGGYPRMISEHVGKCLTEEWRARWVSLLMQSAKEAGLPNDAEFRSAFESYIEWGSRLAVENSQTTSRPPEHMPMPHWDWHTAAGPPSGRISALAAPAEEDAVALPAADEPVLYEKHVKPLFRSRDRQSMTFVFDLWSYDDVGQHAAAILARLRDGSMPCDSAWPQERIDVFQRWIDTGKTA